MTIPETRGRSRSEPREPAKAADRPLRISPPRLVPLSPEDRGEAVDLLAELISQWRSRQPSTG
jgi:hypothetical protein